MEAVSRGSLIDPLAFAKHTIRHEAEALTTLANNLGGEFTAAVSHFESCAGAVIVTGMGKAGLIGQKISATFCSTGTRSHFLHPAEAIHGDLGRVASEDIVLAFSMSGETEELVRVLPSLRKLSSGIVAITASRESALGQMSKCVLELGQLNEGGSIRLAPSTSTTAMLAIGDALALTLCERRGFDSRDFAKFHPGGSLGRKLTKVHEMMRPLKECRVALQQSSVCETFMTLRCAGRRTGAVMIVNDQQQLVGVFTDSDLARLLERQTNASLDRPVCEVMTRQPITIVENQMMPTAIRLLADNQISELPVLDTSGRPVGMIDITDVIGWFPNSDVGKLGDKQSVGPTTSATAIVSAAVKHSDQQDNSRTATKTKSKTKRMPDVIPFPGVGSPVESNPSGNNLSDPKSIDTSPCDDNPRGESPSDAS